MIIFEKVEKIAKANPEKIALIWAENGQEVCYSDLISNVLSLANNLLINKILPGDVVALCIENDPIENINLVLALNLISVTIVPLDPQLKINQINRILSLISVTKVISNLERFIFICFMPWLYK